MKPPRLPEEPPPVLREAELRALLAACERDKTFAGRRDEAVLRMFMDTGARRGEVLGLGVGDVDLDQGLLRVTGKGSRTRLVPIGARPSAPSIATCGPREAPARGDSRPVARQEGPADRVRARGTGAGSRAPGRDPGPGPSRTCSATPTPT